MDTDNCLFLSITGQIESCYFPIGYDGSQLFCRYDITAGPDWELVSGMTSGVTQSSCIGNRIEDIVFNMPLEIMYRTTNVFGWPQIVFSLYGKNWWGNETSKGYARIHVPLSGNRVQIRAPVIAPKCSNIWSSVASWFTDRRPELKDPKILLEGNQAKGLLLESYGEIIVSLQAISRGGEKLSLDWGQR